MKPSQRQSGNHTNQHQFFRNAHNQRINQQQQEYWQHNMADDYREEGETKYLTWTIFFKSFTQGWRLILDQLKDTFLTRRHLNSPISSLSGSSSSDEINENDNQMLHRPVRLVYGFTVLSKISAAFVLWVVSFILDIRLGLQPSRKFAAVSHSLGITGIVLGTWLGQPLFASVFDQVLPGIVKRVAKFISGVAQFAIVMYVSYGLLCMIWVIYNRRFLYDFILYKCSNIMVPVKFQQRTAVYLFVGGYLFSIMAEPLMTVLTMYSEFKQPQFFPQLTSSQFTYVRALAFFLVSLATSYFSSLQSFIPVVTCFMISVLDKHVEKLLEKQVSRLFNTEQRHFSNLEQKDANLENLLTSSSRQLLKDFSVDTLCMNWPSIDTSQQSTSQPVHSRCASNSVVIETLRVRHNRALIIGSRLFLLRNVAKFLSELKSIILAYTQIFGIFHFVFVCLNGLLVAQWFVVGVVQTRFLLNDNTVPEENKNIIFTPLLSRSFFSLTLFILSNTMMFHYCDRLSSRMVKLRTQLFKINLDLVHLCHDGKENDEHLNFHEIQLAWSLYDQVVNISKKANFKFMGRTYYSKNCLLLIFSNEISLILFYLQVIDIYSNV